MAQFVEKFAEPGDSEYAPPPKEVELPVSFNTCVDLSFSCGLCFGYFKFIHAGGLHCTCFEL